MNIRFLKIAQIELDSAIEYYNIERSGLGYEFLWEVFSAIDKIKEFPEAWQIFDPTTRRILIRRFPYGLIYSIQDDLILIMAVANLHRGPDYWAKRTNKNI